MHKGYIDINGIPTKVLTYGKWVEDDFSDDEPRDIVLFIPGNPGITEFYCDFLETIHKRLGWPVWMVGHAGHELPEDNKHQVPTLAGNETLYSVQGQKNHKQLFIQQYIPKNARIHFVGHSLGSYLILQLLKVPSISSQCAGNYLLFPVFERIRESDMGWYLTTTPSIIWRLLSILFLIFSMLPLVVKSFVVKCYMICFSISETQLGPILTLLEPNSFSHGSHLGTDAIMFVKERDTDVLVQNKHKTKLYYGASDLWTPPNYCQRLNDDIPGIDAQICNRNIQHAFVFKHSETVGHMVADWIKN